MTETLRTRPILILGLLCVFLAGFLFLTDPNELPIGVLIVPILLVFFITYLLCQLIADIFKLFPGKKRRRRTFSLLMAMMVGTAMILQSTGGLIINDIIIIGIIILVSLLYVSRF